MVAAGKATAADKLPCVAPEPQSACVALSAGPTARRPSVTWRCFLHRRCFIAQGPFQARSIFESLDLAWSLLRAFPRELLKKIPKKQLEIYYRKKKEVMDDVSFGGAEETKA